jgi:hypothetical protein
VGGEKVVDLWGGGRNADTGAPWERDTMVVIPHLRPRADTIGGGGSV